MKPANANGNHRQSVGRRVTGQPPGEASNRSPIRSSSLTLPTDHRIGPSGIESILVRAGPCEESAPTSSPHPGYPLSHVPLGENRPEGAPVVRHSGSMPTYIQVIWSRRHRLMEHEHVSPFGQVECTCTEQEAENLALITAYRAAKVAERHRFFAPGYRCHRAAFQSIGNLNGVHHHGDDAMADRRNVVMDMTAKDDNVWAIWRVVGHHTGDWYGLPATGRPVDAIEAGMWRVEDDLIAEARFFGDELALLQQLDLFEASKNTSISTRLPMNRHPTKADRVRIVGPHLPRQRSSIAGTNR